MNWRSEIDYSNCDIPRKEKKGGKEFLAVHKNGNEEKTGKCAKGRVTTSKERERISLQKK